MNTLLFDSAASTPLWILLKASLLLLIAAIVQLTLFRRGSAATRHSLWTLALLAIVVLPAVAAVAPQWPLIVHRTSSAAVAAAPASAAAADPPVTAAAPAVTAPTIANPGSSGRAALSPAAALIAMYLAGVGGLLGLWLVERWKLVRLARHATLVDDPAWSRLLADSARRLGVRRPVRLLRSRAGIVPMAFGTRRPAIMMPAIADTWPDARRRAVLLHELAHVVRHDCLTQTVAAAACALYWFHPGVWWAARRLRVERELACDDHVLAAGTTAREYAEHLLEIAYSFAGQRAPALAVCMARPRQLEGRMLAALDAARNRAVPGRRVRLAITSAAIVLLAVLAGSRPVTSAATPPGDQDEAWPATRERPARESDRQVTDQQLKDIASLLRGGLSEARSRVTSMAASVGLNQEQVPGTWEIRPTDTTDTVHLRIVERNSSTGTNVPIGQLEGLTAAQLTGAGGPVQFRMRRDAGTFTFDGVIRNGVGAGTFSFVPDANFPAEMARRGYSRPTAREQYQMARHDVGLELIDELNRQGYAKGQTADLVRAGQHGVQAAYLREMGSLGYRLGSLDPLITLRDHGVTPAYVRGLADQGYKGLAADDVREARDHGVTPEYIRGMREAGYGTLPMAELIRVRDHGITPEFARELGRAGYTKLTLEQLVGVRDHGVSPEYITELKALGFTLPVEDIVRTRDHGVTVEFVRAMAALGYGGQSMDALIRVRDHGVTEQYVKEVKALGYDTLTLDDLVSLRDHGMTPDRIRRANERAGARLPIDMLRTLAAGGMR